MSMRKTLSVAMLWMAVLAVNWRMAQADSVPLPDLLYYRFDEPNGSVTTNLASPGVGPLLATFTGFSLTDGGQYNGALQSSGTSAAHLDTGWTTALGGNSWTLSMWLDLRNCSIASDTARYLFGDYSADQFRAFTGGVAGDSNVILRLTGVYDVPIPVGSVTSAPVTVAWVYDASAGEIRGYTNGVRVTTVHDSGIYIVGSDALYIGNYNYPYTTVNSLPNGGKMDEFRLYSYALTDSQMLNMIPEPAAVGIIVLLGGGLIGWRRLRRWGA